MDCFVMPWNFNIYKILDIFKIYNRLLLMFSSFISFFSEM